VEPALPADPAEPDEAYVNPEVPELPAVPEDPSPKVNDAHPAIGEANTIFAVLELVNRIVSGSITS
jgi:hypothetical protein